MLDTLCVKDIYIQIEHYPNISLNAPTGKAIHIMHHELEDKTKYRTILFKAIGFILLGLILFFWVYSAEPLPDAVDPMGKHVKLTLEGKAAIALFMLVGTWWVCRSRSKKINDLLAFNYCPGRVIP